MRSVISLIVLVAALLCAAAQSQSICSVDLTELYPVPMAAYSGVSQ